MGAATGRAFFGDFRLWREVYEPTEVLARGELQQFKGVDRATQLVIPASANMDLELRVRCLVAPNPSAQTLAGLVALARAQRVALVARCLRADPVVWVEDDTTEHTVGSYAAPTVTSVAHGLSNGDVVLLVKATGGVGEYLLASVSNVTANTYDVASLEALGVHVPVSGTRAWRVEAYWRGMVYAPAGAALELEDGGWWAREAVYVFKGSGTNTYARTTGAAAGL